MQSDTKSQILLATRRLIDNKGLAAVTLRAVGDEVGLSRGAAYRYFPDKESLLAEIVTEDFQILLQSFERRRQECAGIEILVRTLLDEFYAFGLGHKSHYRLMFSTEWDRDKFPRLHEYALAVFRKIEEFLSLLAAERSDEIGPATDMAAVVFSFVHGIVELHHAGHSEMAKGLDEPGRLFDLLVRMIAGPGR